MPCCVSSSSSPSSRAAAQELNLPRGGKPPPHPHCASGLSSRESVPQDVWWELFMGLTRRSFIKQRVAGRLKPRFTQTPGEGHPSPIKLALRPFVRLPLLCPFMKVAEILNKSTKPTHTLCLKSAVEGGWPSAGSWLLQKDLTWGMRRKSKLWITAQRAREIRLFPWWPSLRSIGNNSRFEWVKWLGIGSRNNTVWLPNAIQRVGPELNGFLAKYQAHTSNCWFIKFS